MNFLEAIAELQKPENIKTKCIRPAAWGVGENTCYDHFIIDEGIAGALMLCYESEHYDPYESNPFYIPYYVDVLTGEWIVSTIPDTPVCSEDEE